MSEFPQLTDSTALSIELQTSNKDWESWGHLGGAVVEPLPSAQGVVPGPGIMTHIRLPAGNLLLPLPMSLPLSLCLS